MSIQPFQTLRCPLDENPLRREGARWCCESGHSFDMAREGYVNLLPVQQKRSKDPGDSKEMVLARRSFLNDGHYRRIADAVVSAVLRDIPGQTLSCLDAGCGEGYYLRQLARQAPAEIELSLSGLDISKWAVQAAAKQEATPTWMVASNANIPVASASLDRVLCLFGFPVYAEFARVLKPDALLLMVDPGPEHLRQLREVLYPALKDNGIKAFICPKGFEQTELQRIESEITLDSAESIRQLLGMTPHYYRANAERRELALALERITLTVDVQLRSLRRTDQSVELRLSAD